MTSEAGPLPEASERNSGDASTSKPSADPEGSTIVFAKRRNRGNIRKKPTSEAGGEGEEAGEGLAPLIKRPARTQAPAQGTEQPASDGRPFAFESSNTLQQSQDGGATRNLETETAHDRDARLVGGRLHDVGVGNSIVLPARVCMSSASWRQAIIQYSHAMPRTPGSQASILHLRHPFLRPSHHPRALREQVLAQQAEEGGAEGATYKGMNNYRDYRAGFRREQTIGAEKGGGAHGPLRASTNVRMTVRVDYQPDICKDYKETGYCGFGDACKFLHDRGDYKAGYELDREWEEKQKRERERLLTNWAGAGEAEASGGYGGRTAGEVGVLCRVGVGGGGGGPAPAFTPPLPQPVQAASPRTTKACPLPASPAASRGTSSATPW